jgi:general secretion pathway protein D
MKKRASSRMTAYSLMLASVLAATSSAQAQLDKLKKFKSETKMRPQQVQSPRPSASNNFGRAESFTGASDSDDSNTQTFGNRSNPTPTVPNSKYVNLNPETAFGPEIITSFDFPDTDIMEITKHMQKLTGINLILDKDVKGKVSITAPTAITVGDAWKAYLAALNMAGYTMVKAGAFYKIINARDVRYVPTKIYTGAYTPDTEAHMMKVIALKNVDAGEISRNFRPFMSRYGRIIDIKQTNTIIISDTGANIARLEKLIKFLDVPGYDESLQIIRVTNTSASEIAKLLDQILKGGSRSSSPSSGRARGGSSSARFSGGSSGGSSSQNSNISKIIAEPRTNSIIAMANAAGAEQLRNLIKKLDVKLVSANSDKIHVLYLNYGNAEELAKTLSTLVSGAKASQSKGPAARNFTKATEDGSTLFNGEVKVTADKNNNALVVTASPTDWLTLKNVIAKLDIPRDQVYVEGLIVETTLTKVRAFGVEYLGAYGAGNAQRGGFLNDGSLVSLISGNPTSLSGFFVGGGGGGSVTIPNPAGGDDLTVNSVNGLIKAIATNSATNVLATPQILAMDNTDAEFEVGSTIPIKRQTTTNGTVTETIEQQEAKLSLKITPQINKVTRFVKLKINQSINDFAGETDTSGNGAATNTRSAVTEVMVRDRDTIAMGGLLRDKESISFSKVPLLGDIPVLGWLFKNKTRRIDKVNMLFFLTPRILSPYEKSASNKTMEALAKRAEHLKKDLADDEDPPFKDTITKLNDKVKKQIDGPIYDTAIPNQYEQNNNSDGIGAEASAQDEQIETPDYQEIIDEVEEKKE